MRITAERLLALYPRAWRARYGEEFVATAGEGPLALQQVIDIVAGAIDAWLSADVRHAAAVQTGSKGDTTMWTTMLRCDRTSVRFDRSDAFIGAAVTLGVSVLFAVILVVARRFDWSVPLGVLTMLGFPGSVVVAMPFTYLKGQPWKAQAVIVGGLLAVLVLIGYVATPA